MTQDEAIEFDRLKTARDSLLLTVANLRGQLETIASDEREACARICADELERMQQGIETLHAMYVQVSRQRDELMDEQRSMVAAMRGRIQ
jgi:uncharacterized coiled-coil DUF342 family protein